MEPNGDKCRVVVEATLSEAGEEVKTSAPVGADDRTRFRLKRNGGRKPTSAGVRAGHI